MLEEIITPPSTTDNSFDPEIIYNYGKGKIKFKGICLKQDSVSFIHGDVVSLYISSELDTCSTDLKIGFTLGNCLFGAVKVTKNADLINTNILIMVLGLYTFTIFVVKR